MVGFWVATALAGSPPVCPAVDARPDWQRGGLRPAHTRVMGLVWFGSFDAGSWTSGDRDLPRPDEPTRHRAAHTFTQGVAERLGATVYPEPCDEDLAVPGVQLTLLEAWAGADLELRHEYLPVDLGRRGENARRRGVAAVLWSLIATPAVGLLSTGTDEIAYRFADLRSVARARVRVCPPGESCVDEIVEAEGAGDAGRDAAREGWRYVHPPVLLDPPEHGSDIQVPEVERIRERLGAELQGTLSALADEAARLAQGPA